MDTTTRFKIGALAVLWGIIALAALAGWMIGHGGAAMQIARLERQLAASAPARQTCGVEIELPEARADEPRAEEEVREWERLYNQATVRQCETRRRAFAPAALSFQARGAPGSAGKRPACPNVPMRSLPHSARQRQELRQPAGAPARAISRRSASTISTQWMGPPSSRSALRCRSRLPATTGATSVQPTTA
jgi:hypothetical protein